jgi:aminoglycoside phosphotransferase (APT) family kinase protein
MPGCTPQERAAAYADTARVLAALHGVDWRAAGLEGFGKPQGYVARQVRRWTGQYLDSKVEDCPAMDHLAAWLARQSPPADEEAIAHGDFRLGNMVLHPVEPRIVAVLDWELATLGHPLADLAYSCLVYHLPVAAGGLAPGAAERLGIPGEAEYVAAYCRAAGREGAPGLPQLVVFSMFRLAAIAAGVYRRALDGNAAARVAPGRDRGPAAPRAGSRSGPGPRWAAARAGRRGRASARSGGAAASRTPALVALRAGKDGSVSRGV